LDHAPPEAVAGVIGQRQGLCESTPHLVSRSVRSRVRYTYLDSAPSSRASSSDASTGSSPRLRLLVVVRRLPPPSSSATTAIIGFFIPPPRVCAVVWIEWWVSCLSLESICAFGCCWPIASQQKQRAAPVWSWAARANMCGYGGAKGGLLWERFVRSRRPPPTEVAADLPRASPIVVGGPAQLLLPARNSSGCRASFQVHSEVPQPRAGMDPRCLD